jgi:DNA-binding MarR family transcriptional regulator
MKSSHPASARTPEPLVDAVLSASRVLVAVAARSIAGMGDDVTLPQYRTLVVLASRGPQSLAGLAEAIGVTSATATRMCDRLVRKGLIRRRTERDDRRQLRVGLTPQGRELVETVTHKRRQEIAHIVQDIPMDERAIVVQALNRFATAAGEVPEQDWTTGWDL